MKGSKTKLVTLVVAMAMLLSCVTAFAADTDVALTITVNGVEGETTFTTEQLKAVPAEYQIDEEYVYTKSGGGSGAPSDVTVKLKGVSLAYLLEQAGATAEDAVVEFTAADGYESAPQSLAEIKNADLKFVAAYEVDGEVVENVTIYRKQKEAGEFKTVFKVINNIAVGEAKEAEAETGDPEKTEETEDPAADAAFTDITDEYKYAEEAINALAGKNIVSGKGAGLYAPQDKFNRAEFCKIIVTALNLETKDYDGKFTDVKTTDWFAPYVQAAVESGLFSGTSDTTFNPSGVITRQQMATVVARAAVTLEKVSAEKLAKFTMEKSNYTDKDAVAEYAANGVAWLEAEGVFADVAGESFQPAAEVNRAEAAVVIYRALVK